MFDPRKLKADFSIFQRQVHGKPLVYLDNAATSQKPQVVIDSIVDYYTHHNANVHRGVHTLSDESTKLFEDARATVATFLGADSQELIFTRNTTEAINLVAYGWADHNLKPGDEILISIMEHHSNLVVWQEVCKRSGATLIFIPIDAEGNFDYLWLEEHVSSKTKLIALPYVSNALGSVIDLTNISQIAKKVGARVLADGAQAVPHMPVDFAKLGVDFFAFSGHKMLGPMGIGGLLVRKQILKSEEMKPALFGGGMIAEVHQDRTVFHPDIADRFTAGTPDVASAVGLAAACNYLSKLGMTNVLAHDLELVAYLLEKLAQIPEIVVVGPLTATDEKSSELPALTKPRRVGSVAFTYKNVHAHDVAQVLDSEGIAVRSGHHCTMPLHEQFEWVATTRASFQVYNDVSDVDALIRGLAKVKKVFG